MGDKEGGVMGFGLLFSSLQWPALPFHRGAGVGRGRML